jgi:hypothetical protein
MIVAGAQYVCSQAFPPRRLLRYASALSLSSLDIFFSLRRRVGVRSGRSAQRPTSGCVSVCVAGHGEAWAAALQRD